MPLTPVFQDESLCTDCPLRAFCDEDVTTLDVLDLYREAMQARSFASLLTILTEIDMLLALLDRIEYRTEIASPEAAWKTYEYIRDTAIESETNRTWEKRQPAIRLLPIVAASAPPEERLAHVAWHTPSQRVSNPKRKRNGRRRKAQKFDHGTAPARKQVEDNRRERLRKARKNRRNKHYTPDWKFRAQREELQTRGVARGDLIVIDDRGITEGLYYLGVATDPEYDALLSGGAQFDRCL